MNTHLGLRTALPALVLALLACASVAHATEQSDQTSSAPPASSTTRAPRPHAPKPDPESPARTHARATARARALELEQQIQDLEADSIALRSRIAVVNIRILRQQDRLARATADLVRVRTAFDVHLVQLYKNGAMSPLTALVTAESMTDLYVRAALLTRIAEENLHLLRSARVAAAEAQFQAAILDDLKAQQVSLRNLADSRKVAMEAALVKQRGIIARLAPADRRVVFSRQETARTTRRQWKARSVPLQSKVVAARATVSPYSGKTWLVGPGRPKSYRSTGRRFSAVCSWYGNEFHGRTTASGQIFNQNDLTCASRTLRFGTYLALERAGRRVIVVVNDRGPFISGRDLDLSRGAARALGYSGVATVKAEIVRPIN